MPEQEISDGLKIYYASDFHGYYDGTAAIILAKTKFGAIKLLSDALKSELMPSHIDPKKVEELRKSLEKSK